MWRNAIFLSVAVIVSACASTSTTKHAGPLTREAGSNQADTPERRMAAAKRYYLTIDRNKLMDETLRAYVARLPEDKRDEVFALAKAHLDTEALAAISLAGMVKNFNTDELNAMADFYGSPEGKAILAKYPTYIAEVMPQILAEVKREIDEIQTEVQNRHDTRKTGT
jgi:Uncharacterized protein conserved in bacteria (DUF2059)